MKKATMEDRVKAGVAFLNVVKPGWSKKINLKKLDLSIANTCVIGELEGDYYEGIENLHLNQASSEFLGFSLFFREYQTAESEIINYKKLTRIWKKFITDLKKK